MKSTTPDFAQLRISAEDWIGSFDVKTQVRGEELRRQGAVSRLKIAPDGRSVQASVQGGYLYPVSLRFRASEWSGSCACPVGVECKHLYAAMLAAIDGPPYVDESGTHGSAPAAAVPNDVRFAEVASQKLDRPLTGQELTVARWINSVFSKFRYEYSIPNDALFPIFGSMEVVKETENVVWPIPPDSAWEAWLYLAAFARRHKLKLSPFLTAVTPWPEVEELVTDWERTLEVDRWRNWLTEASQKEMAPPSSTSHELRVVLSATELSLEWRKMGMGDFKPIPQTGFRQIQSDALLGQLLSHEDSLRVWRAFDTGYDAQPVVPYQRRDAARILNLLLRDDALLNRVVGPHGFPLPKKEEALAWRVEVEEGDRSNYRLALVKPDHTLPPPMLVAVDGSPALYVSEQGIYHAPPLGGLTPDRKGITIPAEAIETAAGVAQLERMKAEPPPRLANRVRTIKLRLVMRCRIENNDLDTTERLVVEVMAERAAGAVVEQYQKDGWVALPDAYKTGDDEILRVDRTGLASAAELLAALKPTWWPYDSEWHKQVGKKFPEQFSEWLSALPTEVTLLLDPMLASFRDAPVRATVKLEVQESGIDWFDLKVALDIADTTLTKAEIKALLDARGAFVRLGAKGWRRLRFDLSPEDEAQLADLGLAAHDIDGGKQRLHALQLAGKATTKKLISAEHVEKIERRAEEIRTRVSPAVPLDLCAELRPYQIEGFHFLAYLSANRFGGILADDMGLGKTLQTICWLMWVRGADGMTDAAHQKHPALVVCPKSVVDNWRGETARFAPHLRVIVLPRGADAVELKEARKGADLVVINYAQLRILESAITSEPWLAAILDEAQAIKNPDSATAKAACSLKCAHRIALSGTPIENRLLDLWSIMQFAMPGVLGHRAAFGKTFDQRSDPFARRRLAARVRPFVIRRTKREVAKDLPERIEEDMLCELDGPQGTLYRAELKRARAALLKIETKAELDKARFNILTSLMRLRQICCHPALIGAKSTKKKKANEDLPESAKLAALLELIEPLIEEGHKVLVFSQFVEMLNLIRDEFVARDWPYFLLTGATEDRGALVEEFQKTDGAAVFLISLRAGGFGLNLTAASYVVLFDPWWNPAVENQAIDRTHRIGQKNTVIAYRLLMKETIEEKIRALQKQKSSMASDVLGEEAFARTLTLDDFRFLFGE